MSPATFTTSTGVTSSGMGFVDVVHYIQWPLVAVLIVAAAAILADAIRSDDRKQLRRLNRELTQRRAESLQLRRDNLQERATSAGLRRQLHEAQQRAAAGNDRRGALL